MVKSSKFFLVVLSSFALAARAEVRIVGTDLLGADFAQAFYAGALQHRFAAALVLDGSLPAVAEMRSGRAEVALVSRVKLDDALHGFRLEPVAYHTVVVLVPAKCPLPHITLPQLAAVFSAVTTTPARTWADLGVSGEWSGELIGAAAPSAGVGVTTDIFRQAAVQGRELKPTVKRYRDERELRRLLGAGGAIIALAAALPRDESGFRVLPVAARADAEPVLPTKEALQREEYPFRLTLELVTKEMPSPAARPVVAWLRGADAARAFAAVGLVPVTAASENPGEPRPR